MFAPTYKRVNITGGFFAPKSCIFCQHISTASAIQKGIRRSRQSSARPPPSRPPPSSRPPAFRTREISAQTADWKNARGTSFTRRSPTAFSKPPNKKKEDGMLPSLKSRPRGMSRVPPSPHVSMRSERSLQLDGEFSNPHHKSSSRASSLDERKGIRVPMAIPYTTPASEFLYGTSVVEAALVSQNRKLYKLYLLMATGEEKGQATRPHDRLARLATKAGVLVEKVSGNAWMSLLDKLSHGRPHNGCCLEASPVKRPIVSALLAPEESSDDGKPRLLFQLEAMSEEDRRVNGYSDQIPLLSRLQRQPFVLLLDGIMDTGNLGGILRSAHFLGADAVVLSSTCAPLNSVVLKASAGAAEVLPLLTVSDTTGFVEKSRAAGWKVYASVAPPRDNRPRNPKRFDDRRGQRHMFLDSLDSPLGNVPAILMLGGEGSGLKTDLQNKADFTISIRNNRAVGSTVDSLNVSVAAGILLDKFLHVSEATSPETTGTSLW